VLLRSTDTTWSVMSASETYAPKRGRSAVGAQSRRGKAWANKALPEGRALFCGGCRLRVARKSYRVRVSRFAIELIVSTENDVLAISGDENMRSFSSNISPSFGSVNETSMYVPYNLVGGTSGCPGSERGFLRVDRQ